LAQLKRRVQVLKTEAAEAGAIIERIRQDVIALDLPFELVFPNGWPVREPVHSTTKPSGQGLRRRRAAKYADDSGNEWGGRGRRPAWITAALASGACLEDFLLRPAAKSLAGIGRVPTAPAAVRRQITAASAATVATQGGVYRDNQGNEWRGKGRRPAWLRNAIDGGAALADFLVATPIRRGRGHQK
jgi:DNA-binding protein H-NS